LSIRVSVVIPTYKRPHLLYNCLKALAHQDFPAEAFEVIVVDDGPCPITKFVVEAFSEQARRLETEPAQRSGTEAASYPDFFYTPATQTQGPAAARNIGWRMARGAIIAFTDDDCLPEFDWLKEGVAALKEDMDGISGQIIVPISEYPTDYEKNVAGLTRAEFVTANCFYRRTALKACGGFDERFTIAWREDADLFFHMLQCSCKLGYAPAAKVIHPVRTAAWGISIREQRKSMFDALLYKKYPSLYRQRIKPNFPFDYYLIVSSLLGTGLAFWLGSYFWALVLLFFWAILTLQFALRRLHQTRYTLKHVTEMLFTSMIIPPVSIFWRLAGALYYRVLFF